MTEQMHTDTPLFELPPSYSASGKPLTLKMDALQASGSFKLRGVGLRCTRAVRNGATEIICASGGNAGFAAVYVANRLGVAVTIVLPETASPQARDAIAARGATIHVHGASFDDANAYALTLAAANPSAAYVHPFDDPELWEGNATLIDEVVRAGTSFDCVITSVGGGGLLAGIALGLERNGLADVPIIAVETEGAASLGASVAAGHLVTLPSIESIANSLGARTVAQHALDLATTRPITCVTVTDAQAVSACLKFADAVRVLVEPACGAALAVPDVHPELLGCFDHPLIEVCGGIGVSLDRLQEWKRSFAV
jgi:L-serine/L-threonine ammonia-lyase